MGKVINIDDYFLKSHGMTVREVRGIRAYVRFKARNHRLMQEAAEERRRLKQADDTNSQPV